MISLHTALTERLGIELPILNAPMTPQAGGLLAAAVSEAGGLGQIGFDEDESEQSIREQLVLLRARSDRPFGIGLVAWLLARRPDLLDLAIEARPRLVSISFGDPSPYVARLRDAGILVGSQVQNRRWAQTALDAGVDILIAQGTEAGGHTGAVSTLPLLQLVLDMTDKPVIAAGGIATGRGLAAVLAAGATAGWIGTPFLLASESRNTPQARERIAASDETQTVLTSLYDRVQNKAFPAEFRGRALRNAFVDRWHGREADVTPQAREAFREAKALQDFDTANIYAGQSVGLIDRVRPAREIVNEIATGCAERFEALSHSRH